MQDEISDLYAPTAEEWAYVAYLNERDEMYRRNREDNPEGYKAYKRAELARARRVVAEYEPEFAGEEITDECAF